MRLGVAWDYISNANYRAIEPMRSMERRGHSVVWPDDAHGRPDLRRLTGCDVVHVYRCFQGDMSRVWSELARSGTAIVWDNDDDFLAVPQGSPNYKKFSGLRGHRTFSATLKVARLARAVTTTTELLAEKYRHAGIERVEVIGNYLPPQAVRRRARRHDGVVIGWVAGMEHRSDAEALGIAASLKRLLAAHPQVSVECIGVDLRLPERYRHDEHVHFNDLPTRIGGWDIGIAPLADVPFNRTRSDIKLKEYAASGVPWLASPVGPYQTLGESQGGRLVPNDGWFEALDALVTGHRQRRRLARKGRSWAKRQTIDAVAKRWEHLLTSAVAER